MFTGIKRDSIRQLLRVVVLVSFVSLWLTVALLAGSVPTYGPERMLPASIISETGEPYQEVLRFTNDGEEFVYASTPAEGSGGFTTEAIFWIAADGEFHPIDFEHAGIAYEKLLNAGEFLLTGGPGILFTYGTLRFEFPIANKGDAHCCPTAGKLSGTYKIVREEQFDSESQGRHFTFKLVVDTYIRSEGNFVSTDEWNGSLSETQFDKEGEER